MGLRADRDPLKELLSVQKRMNDLFESALVRADFETPGGVDAWSPVVDLFETGDALVCCLELPGLEQRDIELKLEGDELVVSGERKMERERPGERFHRVERAYGKFSRRFHLPSTVDRSAIQAAYRDGVLRVTLPHGAPRQSEPVRVVIR